MASTNKQRYFAPGFLIRLFCACCLLLSSAAFAQTNATIIAHEISPALISVGKSTEFIITLENPNTSILSGQTITYYMTTGGGGSDYPSVTIASSTCGSPVLPAPASPDYLQLSSITLPAASASTPATCQIALSVQAPHAEYYEFQIATSLSSLEPDTNLNNFLHFNAIPAVMVDYRFNPPLLNAPGTSQFEMTLFNLDKSQFSGGEYSYTFPSNLTLSSAPSSSTCPSGVTANASGATLTVNNLSLNAATDTAPYTCKIVFDVTASAMGSYTADFSTPDTDSIIRASLYPPKLAVHNAPPAGKANGFASFSPRIILPGQTAFLTIHIESLAAVPNLTLQYGFDSNLHQLGTPSSTCGTNTVFDYGTPDYLIINFTSTAGACEITIPIIANHPGNYTDFLVNSSLINNLPYVEIYDFYVLSPAGPTPAPASVPSLSNPLLLLLALLMAGFAAMRFRARTR